MNPDQEPVREQPKYPNEQAHSRETVTERRIVVSEPLALPPAAPAARETSPPPLDWLWYWVPLILFIAGAVSVVATQWGVGYAWDESYYYEPAHDAAAWVGLLFTGQADLDSWTEFKRTIDLYWDERHEHPSFQKLMSGASLLLLEDVIGPIDAMRLPMAFLFGLSLVLIYKLGRRAWGRPAGLLAALSYLAMPQIFGYAHFATMETPLVFSMLFLIYAFVRGIRSRWWAVLTGVALGLLLATKINGFFLIPPLLIWGYVYSRPRCVHNFFSMLIFGPLVFVLLWPWLWPDPVNRLLDYLVFHARHQQTAVWFEGRLWGYGNENAPWYYPSVMIAVTVPVTILAFGALGLLRSVLGIIGNRVGALLFFCAAVQWMVASAPQTPKYDGIRLFITIFPFVALFAGAGAGWILDGIRWLGLRGSDSRKLSPAIPEARLPRIVAFGFALILLGDGLLGTIRYYPYLLSYFNWGVGGLPGAVGKGFEATYWGEVVNSDALSHLNRVLPPGAKLKLLALHEKSFQHLQRWRKLRGDIVLEGPPPYDYHLLLWRRGFFARPERALADGGVFPQIDVASKFRVPLLTLHQTGPEFERVWPMLSPAPGPRLAVPSREDHSTTPVLSVPVQTPRPR